ncbi:preprotein translocase, SecG subunit [Candidatus Vecturithrix granuli]|uniref:Protein-export membrane protein SecG n=1 Tax=Vecturithrix granuli TaxID=1499967 RepID=A0A081BY98_VECG1|nr:preprotein translocase, SecG subunit [Candidatus Vecturithrix granuli]
MLIFVTILHTIMCFILIGIVLLQTGKGADMGAAFGGASNTLFGGAGPASFLNKITTIAAVLFMITSFALAIMSSGGGTASKVLESVPTGQTQQVDQAQTPAAQETQAPAPEKTESVNPQEQEASPAPESESGSAENETQTPTN